MEVVINYWAVLLSAVVAIILGFVWFGPLFGKIWMRTIKIDMPTEMTKAMKQAMTRSYALVAAAALVMAAVLAHALFYVTEFTGLAGVSTGITTALWCWLGFMVAPLMGPVLWEDRPWKYFFITSGYWLIALCLMGTILSVWQ